MPCPPMLRSAPESASKPPSPFCAGCDAAHVAIKFGQRSSDSGSRQQVATAALVQEPPHDGFRRAQALALALRQAGVSRPVSDQWYVRVIKAVTHSDSQPQVIVDSETNAFVETTDGIENVPSYHA